jgi:sugar phosphate isomerase/epimerase
MFLKFFFNGAKMKLGTAAWGLRETPIREQLTLTRALNLNNLEISVGNHPNDFLQVDSTSQKIQELENLLQEHSIPPRSAVTGNDFTQDSEKAVGEDVEKVKRVVEICAQMKVRHLRIFSGFSPAAEVVGKRWDRMVDSIRQVTEWAIQHQVTLVMETHGGVVASGDGVRHFESTSTQPVILDRLLQESPRQLRLLFDPANLGALGMNEEKILDLYRQVKNRVEVFHLKDFRRLPSGALVPCACGEGQLDWTKMMPEFRLFEGLGYLEYELPEDVKDGFRRSLQTLASLI